MNTEYRWTDGNDEDFRKFYLKTEEYYSSIVGGLKNREAFVPYNISESISDVLIASVSGTAVGCAGLKAYSPSDVEIKRVWVDPEFRGRHIAADMMDALERKASGLGFRRAILQTRPQMEAAVSLYGKRGYELVENYPPYDKLEGAICFAKDLVPFTLKRLSIEDKEAIKTVFTGVFTGEPWCDDWSDKEQLDLYINDLVGQGYSLTYGLYDDAGELIGISLGYIKHWYTGTEYIINELCVKTDRQGSGAGTFFIHAIENAIKELGLKQIFLLTDSNVPAYEFYKKNGFTECETNVAFAKFI